MNLGTEIPPFKQGIVRDIQEQVDEQEPKLPDFDTLPVTVLVTEGALPNASPASWSEPEPAKVFEVQFESKPWEPADGAPKRNVAAEPQPKTDRKIHMTMGDGKTTPYIVFKNPA